MNDEQLQLEHAKMLAALRNAFQSAVEAVDAYLNFLGQQQAAQNHGPVWNPKRIKWVRAEGTRGPYERYPGEDQKAEATEDFKALIADLKAHNGKFSRDDYFYWLFQDGATVGRKPRKQRPSSSNPHARMGRNLHRVKKAGEKLAKE